MDRTEKFEFLEHTADVYIAAHGTTLEEAYENAALAMFEVITDTDKVSPDIEDSVEVEAEDEYALLYSWLEALLVKFETTNMLYSKFKISNLEETSDGFKIQSNCMGRKIQRGKAHAKSRRKSRYVSPNGNNQRNRQGNFGVYSGHLSHFQFS